MSIRGILVKVYEKTLANVRYQNFSSFISSKMKKAQRNGKNFEYFKVEDNETYSYFEKFAKIHNMILKNVCYYNEKQAKYVALFFKSGTV